MLGLPPDAVRSAMVRDGSLIAGVIRALAPKKKPARKADAPLQFEELGLSEMTLEALRVAGYEEPTAIQAGMIPKAIEGIDLMGQARTGTGKTAAFAIPSSRCWNRIAASRPGR